MERELTIIVTAHNELEYAKVTIEGLRQMADVELLNVVLVDNASQDGLRQWGEEQQDITYIYMDEGREGYGSLLNQVIEALNIDTDCLIMEAHYMLTPFCLSRMLDTLHSEEGIGMVGAVSNGLFQHQRLDEKYTNYELAAEYAMAIQNYAVERVMALDGGAFLISKEVLQKIDGFNNIIGSSFHLVKDLALALLQKQYKSVVCNGAILWDLAVNQEISEKCTRYYHMDQDLLAMEKAWGMHYFNFKYNPYLVDMIQDEKQQEINVLEIGCDLGATLFEIKNRFPNARIYGCELNENAVAVASNFMDAKVCNIETEEVPFDVDGYDYIIYGDVLEHLRDPKKALEYSKSLLKKGGRVIASIPNLMHISVMEGILHGDFTYTETGLLDKTHIHFFTYNEIVRMVLSTGLEVEDINCIKFPLTAAQQQLIEKLVALDTNAMPYMYETFQYLVSAKK